MMNCVSQASASVSVAEEYLVTNATRFTTLRSYSSTLSFAQ